MMKKIKIAQIGTSLNSHGQKIFQSLKKQSDIFDVVGYALPENEREKFPKRMGVFEGSREMTVDEILNDPQIDAVSVETEEIYLVKYAIMVAEHKKHIHMEKPGGTDLAEFEKLVSLVKKNNLIFHIGYVYRYNPFLLDLIEEVKKGKLGEIISVEAQMNCHHPVEVRNWLKTFKGGMMFFLGCHLVDLILKIQGNPQRIIPLNKCSGLDSDGEDFGMALFEYKNGVSFAKTIAIELGGYARRQIVVTGSKKTVEIKPLEMYSNPERSSTLYTDKTEYKKPGWLELGNKSRSEIFERYDTMMSAFAKMIRGEMENTNTPDYELELYKTVLKCCGIIE